MARTPHHPPQGHALRDRLLTCLWWLIFTGGVAAGTAAGLVLALWLALPTLSGILTLVAGWLVGNAVGWNLAARAADTVARKKRKGARRIWHGRRAASFLDTWAAVATGPAGGRVDPIGC